MKKILSALIGAQVAPIALSTALATPLNVVNVGLQGLNCVFSTNCTVVVSNTTGSIALPGNSGSASLQTGTFVGGTGSAAAGLFGYQYRVDLSGVTSGTNCVDQFAVDFGAVINTLAFISNGTAAEVFVITNGGSGSIGVASADQEGSTITFNLAQPVCAGQSSFFIGVVSASGPTNATAFIHETRSGGVLTVAARAPQGAPPCTITCSTNIVTCNDPGQCGAVVHFASPQSTNCDGLAVGCTVAPGTFFPVGTNPVMCAAMDEHTNIVSACAFQVVVLDCEPPVIHSLSASPGALWPPNHKMVPVKVHVAATDNCHLVGCKILSVTSSEAVNAHGSGHTAPDWQITGDLTLNLRAERTGPGSGRIYTITIECIDEANNTATASTEVIVPHDQGHGGKHPNQPPPPPPPPPHGHGKH